NSGVGKSTLLNAIVARDLTVLPQGGIGPLTAQATVVRYSPKKYFRVTYLSRRKVNELLFALERHHEAQLAQQGQPVDNLSAEIARDLSAEELEEIQAALPAPSEPGAPADDKIDGYKRQARLLIT